MTGPAIYAGIFDYNRVLVISPLAVWLAAVSEGRSRWLWIVTPGALWAFLAAKTLVAEERLPGRPARLCD